MLDKGYGKNTALSANLRQSVQDIAHVSINAGTVCVLYVGMGWFVEMNCGRQLAYHITHMRIGISWFAIFNFASIAFFKFVMARYLYAEIIPIMAFC